MNIDSCIIPLLILLGIVGAVLIGYGIHKHFQLIRKMDWRNTITHSFMLVMILSLIGYGGFFATANSKVVPCGEGDAAALLKQTPGAPIVAALPCNCGCGCND